jgi:hypothetical protein
MRTTEEYRVVTSIVKTATGEEVERSFNEFTGHRTLNMPFDCPTCYAPVRGLSGKLVLARFSSPYDGEFDEKFHVEHIGCTPAQPEMSDSDLESANRAADAAASESKEGAPF